jgi:hypothetical protein
MNEKLKSANSEVCCDIINNAISRLQLLTGEDFHGYRSEIWGVVSQACKSHAANLEMKTQITHGECIVCGKTGMVPSQSGNGNICECYWGKIRSKAQGVVLNWNAKRPSYEGRIERLDELEITIAIALAKTIEATKGEK